MNNRIMGLVQGIACAGLLAIPLAAAQVPSTWPAETITGTISMVDLAQHIVVVKDASGVPYDMVITPASHIRSANGRLTTQNLTSDVNKSVSVRFIPEGRGDVVTSINVTG